MHLVWDTETHKMRNGLAAPPGVCLSYTELDTEAGTQTAPALMKWSEAIEFMSDNLPNSSIRWVGHNLCYDFIVVAAAAPRLLPLVFRAYEENRVFDTLARDKLQLLAIGLLADENETGAKRKERFSLDAVILRRFGHLMTNEAREAIVREKKDKNSWRLRYRELEDVPLADWPPDAVSYAKNDAYWSGRVFLDQEREQLARHGTTYIPDEFAQYRAMWWLQLARVWGVRTDAMAVSALAEDLQRRLEHTDKRLKRIGILKGKHAKGQVHWSKDTKKLKEFVVRAYGSEDATPKTEKGGISTEKDTLLAAPEHHLPECTFSIDPKTGAKENYVCAEACITGALHAVAERNGVEKVLNTNVPEFRLGTQMPICPNWNFLVATGRTSVGFWQNPPRKGAVRECVVPRPGFRFVSADWSFIELVTLAQICLDRFGFSKMAEAINLGLDPHLDLAADLMGVSYKEALARKGELFVKDQRQRAKCFHPDTEVLTRRGWVRIGSLVPGEEVMAASPQHGGDVELRWEVPTNLISIPNESGELVHLQNEGINLRVTPDHRMAAFSYNAKKQAIAAPKVVSPEDMKGVRYWPNVGICAEGDRTVNQTELRLAVAIQADGNYPESRRQIRLGFTKQRKIQRMRQLLTGLEDHYKESLTSQGVTLFTIQRELADTLKKLLTPDKTLPWWWLELTPELRRVVLDEAQHWDAHVQDNWRMFQYSSSISQNLDVLQALASMEGRKSRLAVSSEGDRNTNWKLSVKDHHLTRGGNLQTSREAYHGLVVCLTVPSDAVLVRDGGIPVITHQCANFGLPGGLGAEKFKEYSRTTYGVNMTVEEAKALKPRWLRKWPEMVQHLRYSADRTQMGQHYTLVQPRSKRLRGDCGYTDGSNSPFQGLAADGAKHAGWFIAKECYLEDPYGNGSGPTALYGCRTVLFLHDEFILEVPEHRDHEAAMRLVDVMQRAMAAFCPDVKNKAEPALMNRWYKGAEPVYDKPKDDPTRRLIPWEPPAK